MSGIMNFADPGGRGGLGGGGGSLDLDGVVLVEVTKDSVGVGEV